MSQQQSNLAQSIIDSQKAIDEEIQALLKEKEALAAELAKLGKGR